MFLQSVMVYQYCFVIFSCNNHQKQKAMNVSDKIDNIVQYIIQFIEKLKGYVDHIIEFFSDLKDRIEGLLEYIDDKLQSISGVVEELKQHQEEAAA